MEAPESHTGGDEGAELDLTHLRNLFNLLKEFNVAAFTGAGIAVNFMHEPDESPHVPLQGRTKAEVVADEDANTSSRPIAGFSEAGGWRNPALWPQQAGKTLNFRGTYD